MTSVREVRLGLNYAGTCHRFKFFQGTPQSELFTFIRELLGIADNVRFQLLDKDGDRVLLNSCVPSGLELHVVLLDDQRNRTEHATEQYLMDIAGAPKQRFTTDEKELLEVLSCAERIGRAAGLARRRLLDGLGPAQAQRLVFRKDTPVQVRLLLFEFCTVSTVVRCAEVSRNFLDWVSWEGRRVLPIVDDRVLQGGVESARNLARRVHPSFLRSVIAKDEFVAAGAFLDMIVKQEFKPLSSLKLVRVANTQYLPTTLLIRLLRKARGLKHVDLLIRLDRHLPSECLQSVRCLEPLVLHATELHGFPSLFTGGSASVLRRVVLRDTAHLDFNSLLGALPATCAPGSSVRHLEILPSCSEPAGRRWEHWISPVPELLLHPALASVQHFELPVPSLAKVAIECAEALYKGFKEKGAPPGLISVKLKPYESGTTGFVPGASQDAELKHRIETFLCTWKKEWPSLRLLYPGIYLQSESSSEEEEDSAYDDEYSQGDGQD
eukprot:TRINITY_DN46776_c0_g1_i1.p1 TRINITY_DN46776_c0_g1~~TRINITY_DN46776_c0_g1_i1.p1  ORF type:complete len:495 (+),score=86.24 TRINITY_DN46776_c0_g1_i1:101-1585(+)